MADVMSQNTETPTRQFTRSAENLEQAKRRRKAIDEYNGMKLSVNVAVSDTNIRIINRTLARFQYSVIGIRSNIEAPWGRLYRQYEVPRLIEERIKSARADLKTRIDETDKVIKNSGFERVNIEYRQTAIAIFDPLDRLLVDMLLDAQRLENNLTQLWISRVISDRDKIAGFRSIDNQFFAIRNFAQSILNRAIRPQASGSDSTNESTSVELIEEGAEIVTNIENVSAIETLQSVTGDAKAA
jgi:hypothetical protein